jgi:hypothetical protein
VKKGRRVREGMGRKRNNVEGKIKLSVIIINACTQTHVDTRWE